MTDGEIISHKKKLRRKMIRRKKNREVLRGHADLFLEGGPHMRAKKGLLLRTKEKPRSKKWGSEKNTL